MYNLQSWDWFWNVGERLFEALLFGDGVLEARVCFSSCSSCLCDQQIADSFSYLELSSLFSILTCVSCSINLSTSASNWSSFLRFTLLLRGLTLLVPNSVAKALKASPELAIGPSWKKFNSKSFEAPDFHCIEICDGRDRWLGYYDPFAWHNTWVLNGC